jgi:hypothetical protein
MFEITCSREEYGYSFYFFPLVDVLAHSVAALFFKYLMTNSIYISVRTVQSASLLAVFFRVILVDITCSASYCGYTWTDYKTDTDIAKEINIMPVLNKI